MGAAISIAAGLLAESHASQGGRVLVFTSGPCTTGPGSVVGTDMGENLRSHQDLEKNASKFRSAAVVPMRFSKSSHQGLTGFYMGQYDAAGNVDRLTKYIMVATSSSSGKAKKAAYRPAGPTKKLLP